MCSPTPVTEGAGNGEPPPAVALAGPGKRVGNLVEENLIDFVHVRALAEIARERDPLLAVDALAKACLCVVPSKAPLVESVLGQELTRS